MKSNNRYLGAAMIAPFIVFVFLGGIYLKCFIFALSAMALWEFYNALKENDLKPMRSAGYILLIIYYLLNNNFRKYDVCCCCCNVHIIDISGYKFEIYFY